MQLIGLENGAGCVVSALRSCGVLGIDLNRRPDAADWLLVVAGENQVIPVRTDQSGVEERLGVVVWADRPPTHRALRLLGEFASGNAVDLSDVEGSRAGEARIWALETAARIVATVQGSGPSAAVQ